MDDISFLFGSICDGQKETSYEKNTRSQKFHLDLKTAQMAKLTVSKSARREVLSRLLRLNHERYEEEQKSGEMESGKKKVKNGKFKSTDGQMGLLWFAKKQSIGERKCI